MPRVPALFSLQGHGCNFSTFSFGRWNKPQSVPTCMLTNLKTMEFKRARGYECEMKFLKYILGNSKALKMLRITCDATRYLLRKEEEWLCAVIFMLPKASKNCQIRFLGSWPRSTARLC
ncbi:FBD-like protein [Artemisia annua]|uniref:FBD-like protein n=1 Tax=Artemisia annua TaxID=35608 RepID=A0A2U1L0S6_ARTAN|nr:FBD-like protein [Artemisia annua]